MEDMGLLKEQMILLEEHMLKPNIRKSAEELDILIADDFMEIGSSGRTYTKAQVLGLLPDSTMAEMTIFNFDIKVLALNIVQTTFRISINDSKNEEKKYSIRSSIWRFQDGKWQIVFHQGTPVANLINGKAYTNI